MISDASSHVAITQSYDLSKLLLILLRSVVIVRDCISKGNVCTNDYVNDYYAALSSSTYINR